MAQHIGFDPLQELTQCAMISGSGGAGQFLG